MHKFYIVQKFLLISHGYYSHPMLMSILYEKIYNCSLSFLRDDHMIKYENSAVKLQDFQTWSCRYAYLSNTCSIWTVKFICIDWINIGYMRSLTEYRFWYHFHVLPVELWETSKSVHFLLTESIKRGNQEIIV